MSESLVLHYKLNMELWQNFYDAHYAADRSLKVRSIWGVICIVIGSLGVAGVYSANVIAGLLMVSGFYAVLSKQILLVKSLRNAKKHPFFDRILTVELGPDEIAVHSGTSGYNQPWSNFSSYRDAKPGFMFYHDANAFFFVPREAMTDIQVRHLETILEGVKLTRR